MSKKRIRAYAMCTPRRVLHTMSTELEPEPEYSRRTHRSLVRNVVARGLWRAPARETAEGNTTLESEGGRGAWRLSRYEQLKLAGKTFVGGRDLNSLEMAGVGAFAGGFTGFVTTPLDVIKTRLMTQVRRRCHVDVQALTPRLGLASWSLCYTVELISRRQALTPPRLKYTLSIPRLGFNP